MIGGIIFANTRGDILLTRMFRNDLDPSISEMFRYHVLQTNNTQNPVTPFEGVSFLYIKVGDTYVVAATGLNANSLVIFEFLYKLVAVLTEYFGKFNSSVLRGNFPLIHELLEELLDFGYPQITDLDTLQVFITQGKRSGIKLKLKEEKVNQLTSAATGATPWRQPNITYSKNQIWMTATEKVNLLLSIDGTILKNDVEGTLVLKCELSGTPTCEFGLNDKLRIEGKYGNLPHDPESSPAKKNGNSPKQSNITFDDITFHQCVRLQRFETERVVSFVPPDGEFVLMRYRSNYTVPPFKISTIIKEINPNRLGLDLHATSFYDSSLSATNITIFVPTPPDTACCRIGCKEGDGKPKFDSYRGGILWRIKRWKGKEEKSIAAIVDMIATRQKQHWDRPPITMQFSVPFSVSGFQVTFMKITDKSGYEPAKWIKYQSEAGNYHTKMNT